MSDAPKARAPGIALYDEGEPVRRLMAKKYGAGKAMAWMTGPAEYAEIAAECLRGSLTTVAVIMKDQFRQRMAASGVPESVIETFLASAMVDDETFLRSVDD